LLNTNPALNHSNEPWYVVHCQARKEFYAANVLTSNLGLTVFLPWTNISGKIQKKAPFFPGYLFIQVDLQKVPLSHINTTPGVLRLVEFDGDLQPIPTFILRTIYEQLDCLNRPDHLRQHNFNTGDHVRVKNGSLHNLEMIFVGPTTPSKHVYVLLNFLSRLKEVKVNIADLEKIPTPPSTHHERYTRGKGRKIKHQA
jgi:transcriptional antiterminator RfaH